MENSIKSIFTINPAAIENTECSINHLSVPKLLIKKWVCCLTMLYRFQPLLATFQEKNSVKSTTASASLTQVSHWSHNSHATNCHLYSSKERNGAQRRTKLSFDRTMMLWLAGKKSKFRDQMSWNNEEIKPVVIAIIELHLPEGKRNI